MGVFPVYSACDLISNDNNKESEIVVHNLEDLTSNEHYLPKKPHRHTFNQIIFVEKGNGNHIIDFEDNKIEPPVIYFISSGQVHNLILENEKTLGYLINFNVEFFSSFLSPSNCVDKMPFYRIADNISKYNVPQNLLSPVKDIFGKINYEYLKKTKSNNLIRIYVLELLYTILENYRTTDEDINITNQKYLIQKFQKLVEEKYTEQHYPKFYADKLAITANYLNFVCKSFTGQKAGEIIRNRIILEAKRLLINSELSVSQIAFKMGFEDNSYFTKFFKSSTNISPSEFRQNLNR